MADGVVRIAIVGDYQPDHETHPATTAAIGHAAEHLGHRVEETWMPTDAIEDAEQLSGYQGIWIAPGSPYRSLDGALRAITMARTAELPLLGTCAGFQHVVLEFARNVLGIVGAQHAEYDPQADSLFVTPLACSLAGQSFTVQVRDGSRACAAYGAPTAVERYYCNFGLNPERRDELENAGLAITGVDDQGEPRIVEVPGHPFFVGTLFVPQVASTQERPHPLVLAFVAAATMRIPPESAADLVAWRRVSRGSYKPFLHHVTRGKPISTRPVKLRVPRRLPATLRIEDIAVVLAACERLRDRFLFALLAETGMRIGQALGLRHEDFVSRQRRVMIVPRSDNANGARAKCLSAVAVPVSAPLVRLYSDYMHTEYRELDSDYVFVNLWSEPVGRPLRYQAVAKLVSRLSARTGIEFTPHMLRHSRATELIRGGVPIEVVSKLLTHRSVTTTSDAYVHLDVEDLRAELVRAGAWEADQC